MPSNKDPNPHLEKWGKQGKEKESSQRIQIPKNTIQTQTQQIIKRFVSYKECPLCSKAWLQALAKRWVLDLSS